MIGYFFVISLYLAIVCLGIRLVAPNAPAIVLLGTLAFPFTLVTARTDASACSVSRWIGRSSRAGRVADVIPGISTTSHKQMATILQLNYFYLWGNIFLFHRFTVCPFKHYCLFHHKFLAVPDVNALRKGVGFVATSNHLAIEVVNHLCILGFAHHDSDILYSRHVIVVTEN